MQQDTIIALDVGTKRIGVAIASMSTKFARPLVTLEHSDIIWSELNKLVEQYEVGAIVVGLPRGLEGQETAQTKKTEVFMQELRANVGLPVHSTDEAVTSVQAEAELKQRGKPYEKGDIDALAATYILEDYLKTVGNDHAAV